jgi:hypothetical protein
MGLVLARAGTASVSHAFRRYGRFHRCHRRPISPKPIPPVLLLPHFLRRHKGSYVAQTAIVLARTGTTSVSDTATSMMPDRCHRRPISPKSTSPVRLLPHFLRRHNCSQTDVAALSLSFTPATPTPVQPLPRHPHQRSCWCGISGDAESEAAEVTHYHSMDRSPPCATSPSPPGCVGTAWARSFGVRSSLDL